MNSLRRIACLVTVTLGICVGFSAVAQDSEPSTGDINAAEIFQKLQATPATALDVGLIGLQQSVTTSFLANKPEIFRPGMFRFLDVVFLPESNSILIEGTYRADKTSREELAAECKDNIDLVMSTLTLRRPEGALSGSPAEKKDICIVTSFNVNRSAPGASGTIDVCRYIRIWFRVKATDLKASASCSRDFGDKETKIHFD